MSERVEELKEAMETPPSFEYIERKHHSHSATSSLRSGRNAHLVIQTELGGTADTSDMVVPLSQALEQCIGCQAYYSSAFSGATGAGKARWLLQFVERQPEQLVRALRAHGASSEAQQ